MKTPEEIKKALEICDEYYTQKGCTQCPYFIPFSDDPCQWELLPDVIAYIQQLEQELKDTQDQRDGLTFMLTNAQSAFETVKRERDAAINDIPRRCKYCVRKDPVFLKDGKMDDVCWTCFQNDHCNWKWRGMQREK